MNLRVLPTVVATGLMLSVLLVAAPAQAAPAVPVISDLDSSTAGHLTGTVTSPGAPYITLTFNTPNATHAVTLNGDTDTFDVPTWGLAADSTVRARGCDQSTCSADSDPVPFQPTDVVPEVTWSEDQTIGSRESAAITVEDTGGGILRAVFERYEGESLYGGAYTVDKHGTTRLSVGPGTGLIVLQRCASESGPCAPFNPTVAREYTGVGWPRLSWTPDSLPALTQANPTASVTISGELQDIPWPAGSTYEFTWTIRKTAGTVLKSGSATGDLAPDQTELTTIPLSSADFPEGVHKITGHLTVHTADFGDIAQILDHTTGDPLTFRVDAKGPKVTAISASRTVIYPGINLAKYPTSTAISITSAANDLGYFAVTYGSKTIATVSNNLLGVNSMTRTWNGRKDNGTVASPARYRIYAIDYEGNRSTKYTEVVVSSKSLVTKTWRRTVSASGSLLDTYVGPCSTLSKPSKRGWSRSLGYYANTKCGTQTWHSSAVSTVHGLKVPSAVRYLKLTISAYGGGAPGGIPDRAALRYLKRTGSWGSERGFTSGLTWHPGHSVNAADYVNKSHELYWGFATGYKNRYDVKAYSVVLTYQVIG